MAARKVRTPRSGENRYALEGRQGPALQRLARTWTPQDQEERLAGYIEVPREFWEQLRYGSHIRYYTAEGEYRPGGFVVKCPTELGGGKKGLRIQNGFDKKAQGYFAWAVGFPEVSRIFVKPDAGTLVVLANVEAVVKGLNENIRRIVDFVRSLEVRVSALDGARGRAFEPLSSRSRSSSRESGRGSERGSREGSREPRRH